MFSFAGSSDQVITPTSTITFSSAGTRIVGHTYTGRIVVDGSSLPSGNALFHVQSSAEHASIRNLLIRNVANGSNPAAVYIDGASGVEVIGCRFEDDDQPIYAPSGSTIPYMWIIDNRFDRSLQEAVRIDAALGAGGLATINWNTVQDGSANGIQLTDATNVAVDSNSIRGNAGDGVVIQGGADSSSSLRANHIIANGAAGIILKDSAAVVETNKIKSSGTQGIGLIGCTSTLTSNVSADNSGFGIVVVPDYGADLSASGTGDDINGNATIGSDAAPVLHNTVTGNGAGGIALFDTTASNASSVYADNSLSGNSAFEAAQAWYGMVEVYDSATGLGVSGLNVTISGTGGSPTFCSATSGAGGKTFGSTSDVSTWCPVLQWAYAPSSSVKTTYTNHLISVSGGAYTASYSWDAIANDGTNQFGEPKCRTVGSLCRYQIGEVAAP